MKNVVLGGLAYALASASPSLLMSVALGASATPGRNAVDDFLMAAWIAGSSTLFRTIGFLIPTALSAGWRSVALSRVLIVSGALGLVTPVVSLLVLALTANAILALFHSAAWAAVVFMFAPAGVLLGFVAVRIGRAWERRRAGTLTARR
jgi:hypothetical protein